MKSFVIPFEVFVMKLLFKYICSMNLKEKKTTKCGEKLQKKQTILVSK